MKKYLIRCVSSIFIFLGLFTLMCGNTYASGYAAGIMGAYPTDFSFIKAWGANTVHFYYDPTKSDTVGSAFATAKSLDMNMWASVKKVEQIDGGVGGTFDIASMNADPTGYFPDQQTVAGDPAFLGYWIVDEPCNPRKQSPVQAQDFDDLYQAVKAINPKIPIIINFGDLNCLTGFIATSPPGLKFTDIATFTVTEKKLSQNSNYLQTEAGYASQIKAYDSAIKVYVQITASELGQLGQPMPAASWVQSTGLSVLNYPVFDSLMYVSFHTFATVNFIGPAVIDTVKTDPAYISAYTTVFAAANPPVLPSPSPSSIPGDVDGNGTVDFNDLKLVLLNILDIPACGAHNCDLNSDNKVNVIDAVLVLIHL